ncbi:uncharacterized protein MEPE_02976 [Melanopsichium pennsylvanicum]|uniref:DNA polymerase alpha subunit B N-terminal domain-containing protein n=2 Tax=Melanopsichium pennsylvanicum TaxID=63383 RepID=A0AAJ5C571_9BASI
MPSDLVQRLASHFGPYLAHDPALVSETTSICTHYNVAPEDLFYKWEAFAVNNSLPQSEPLTIDHARELRKIIASSINSGNSANTTHVLHSTPLKPSSALNRAKGIIGGDLGAMLGVKSTPIKTSTNYNNNNDNAFQTPIRNEANTSPFSAPGVTPATASAYKQPHSFSSTQRDMDTIMSDLDQSPLGPVSLATTASSCSSKPKVPRFTILESLNDHLDLICTGSQLASPLSSGAKKWSSSSSRVSLAMATDPKAWNYRYMFEPKSERSLVLDDRIEDFATIFRDAYSIEEIAMVKFYVRKQFRVV